jgi:hypothetical protein
MSITEKILAEVEHLSPERQAEVLDFAGYLRNRETTAEDRAWKEFSLSSAMRGMEDEPEIYTASDIRESIS